jgi:hypothetical protein
MPNITGFEKSILSNYTGWDGDIECMQFYNATLRIDVDEIKAGTVVPTVIFWMRDSIVEFCLTTYDDSVIKKNFEIRLL